MRKRYGNGQRFPVASIAGARQGNGMRFGLNCKAMPTVKVRLTGKSIWWPEQSPVLTNMLRVQKKTTAADEVLGRSKGGFSTNVHLRLDRQGRLMSLCLTPGQRHEAIGLKP